MLYIILKNPLHLKEKDYVTEQFISGQDLVCSMLYGALIRMTPTVGGALKKWTLYQVGQEDPVPTWLLHSHVSLLSGRLVAHVPLDIDWSTYIWSLWNGSFIIVGEFLTWGGNQE